MHRTDDRKKKKQPKEGDPTVGGADALGGLWLQELVDKVLRVRVQTSGKLELALQGFLDRGG